MSEEKLVCRHCGGPIAVPASRCPWCGRQVMVICAACKAYTDDSRETCQVCGAPLVADTMERVRSLPDPLYHLVRDQARARLLTSTLVALHVKPFFFGGGVQRQGILAPLFGRPTARALAAALVFAAYAHLSHEGYIIVGEPAEVDRSGVSEGGEPSGLPLQAVATWDGPERSLEGELWQQATWARTTQAATRALVARLMGFRPQVRGLRYRTGWNLRTRITDRSARDYATAIVHLARLTPRPDYEPALACQEAHKRLAAFIRESPARTRALVQETRSVMDWFEAYQRDPRIVLRRR